jgi:monoamine oxidase
MARTPHMRALQRLVRLQRAADHEGVDVAEMRGRAEALAGSDRGLTRRDVLRRGVVAGAGVTVGGWALNAGRASAAGTGPKSQPSIAVVGAGISGITCARTLKDVGFTNVTVYEANTRIGGRTFTNTSSWDPGQWTEWGGELIDSNHATIHALCERYGLGLIDLPTVQTPGSKDTVYMDGAYYPWPDMVADWEASGADAVLDAQMKTLPNWPWPYDAKWSAAAIALSELTLHDWIERHVPGGHGSRLGRFLDLAYVLEYGAEAREQSCLDLICLLGFATRMPADDWWIWGESDERYKIVGGNQQLSELQADDIGRANIRLGWSMTALGVNPSGTVTLTFGVGGGTRTVTADRVVLALPVGVLKHLQGAGGFSGAGFDARKRAQIAAMPMGAVHKLHVQTSDRFYTRPGVWGNTTGSAFGERFGQFWDGTWGEPGQRGIVCNYFAGDAARAVVPSTPWSATTDPNTAVAGYVRTRATAFLGQVEPAFPGMTARATGKATLAAWHTSPFQRGAYAYWSPGYVHRYCTYERVPQGRVHFAGEHCSQDFQGFINGGAEEGERAANELLALYR